MAALRTALRAAKIQVDGYHPAAALGLQCNVKKLLWVVTRKVRHQRAVVDVALEQVDARAGLGPVFLVDHRGIAQLRAVSPCKQPKRELTAANHGC